MAVRKNSVRGRVVTKWAASRKPAWNTRKTLEVCIDIDRKLEKQGFKPAQQFRKAVKRDDEKYLNVWVLGCHFPWLNPRPK
jgi:alanine racemase